MSPMIITFVQVHNSVYNHSEFQSVFIIMVEQLGKNAYIYGWTGEHKHAQTMVQSQVVCAVTRDWP